MESLAGPTSFLDVRACSQFKCFSLPRDGQTDSASNVNKEHKENPLRAELPCGRDKVNHVALAELQRHRGVGRKQQYSTAAMTSSWPMYWSRAWNLAMIQAGTSAEERRHLCLAYVALPTTPAWRARRDLSGDVRAASEGQGTAAQWPREAQATKSVLQEVYGTTEPSLLPRSHFFPSGHVSASTLPTAVTRCSGPGRFVTQTEPGAWGGAPQEIFSLVHAFSDRFDSKKQFYLAARSAQRAQWTYR